MIALIQVDVPHLCAGMIVDRAIVIEAAPILRWTVKKPIEAVRAWAERKGGTVRCVALWHQVLGEWVCLREERS